MRRPDKLPPVLFRNIGVKLGKPFNVSLIHNPFVFRDDWCTGVTDSVITVVDDNTLGDHKLRVMLVSSRVPLYCTAYFFRIGIYQQFVCRY